MTLQIIKEIGLHHAMVITSSDAMSINCVYSHKISYDNIRPPEITYIGVIQLSKLYSFADARRNSEWNKYVTPDKNILVEVHAIGTFLECCNYQSLLVRQYSPHCNLRGYDNASTLPIRCIEDGKIFNTIMEVCHQYDCTPSAVSNHLRGKTGHKSVKGKHFERIQR